MNLSTCILPCVPIFALKSSSKWPSCHTGCLLSAQGGHDLSSTPSSESVGLVATSKSPPLTEARLDTIYDTELILGFAPVVDLSFLKPHPRRQSLRLLDGPMFPSVI
ncbi:hypothetical protein DL93DRAFT_2091498 [Clavulina sp. PMI_390]|nr:hypothetical protein DL93DRAFT_2091498 [Clavulina sp. PMI_390]